VAWWSV